MTSGGSGSFLGGYRLRRLRRDGGRFGKRLGLIASPSSRAGFRKQGTHCTIRVAMLAADCGAINRPFCFVLRARREMGQIYFEFHSPSLCLDVNVVNSERLPDAWIGEAATIGAVAVPARQRRMPSSTLNSRANRGSQQH